MAGPTNGIPTTQPVGGSASDKPHELDNAIEVAHSAVNKITKPSESQQKLDRLGASYIYPASGLGRSNILFEMPQMIVFQRLQALHISQRPVDSTQATLTQSVPVHVTSQTVSTRTQSRNMSPVSRSQARF